MAPVFPLHTPSYSQLLFLLYFSLFKSNRSLVLSYLYTINWLLLSCPLSSPSATPPCLLLNLFPAFMSSYLCPSGFDQGHLCDFSAWWYTSGYTSEGRHYMSLKNAYFFRFLLLLYWVSKCGVEGTFGELIPVIERQ